MELDLRQMLRIGRRWWWFLVLMPVIAGATAYIVSNQQTPQYSATVTIRINPPASSALDVNAVRLTQDLTETYRRLIVLRPVLEEVIDALQLPYDADELGKHTSASAIASTQLVLVSVTDPDPERAALIANTIASTFATQVTENTLGQIESTRSSLDVQIAALQTQVDGLDTQIDELDTAQNADDVAIQAELEDLRDQRARFQEQIADLVVQGESVSLGVASAQTQVTVSELAIAPKDPYAPKILLNTVLGTLAGLLVAVGIIALVHYLDNSVNEHTEVQELSGVPILATIRAIPDMKRGGHQVYTLASPHSPSAEAVRLLRANLEFASAGGGIATLAITSPGMSEGKSTVAANLAVVMAQTGLTTVLIDADLRRPTQHRIFSIPNETGLTRLITHPHESWRSAGTHVAVPNLTLIPSGTLPPNPADLLSLDRFANLLKTISQEVDIVIIDTPPILAVSDPLLVARNTDAALLVVRSGSTRKDALRHSAEALNQGNIRLLGVVLNVQKSRGETGYYAEYKAATPAKARSR
jgi:non-specific protein-tyrosine kinase